MEVNWTIKVYSDSGESETIRDLSYSQMITIGKLLRRLKVKKWRILKFVDGKYYERWIVEL